MRGNLFLKFFMKLFLHLQIHFYSALELHHRLLYSALSALIYHCTCPLESTHTPLITVRRISHRPLFRCVEISSEAFQNHNCISTRPLFYSTQSFQNLLPELICACNRPLDFTFKELQKPHTASFKVLPHRRICSDITGDSPLHSLLNIALQGCRCFFISQQIPLLDAEKSTFKGLENLFTSAPTPMITTNITT